MPSGSEPMPAVLMKMPSPWPFSTTFVSPVTMWTPASRAASRIESEHAAQVLDGEALFEHEADAEVQRGRAGGRDVVDGAAHGEPPDVAAGEEDRVDDVGVGRERDATGRACRARRRRRGA